MAGPALRHIKAVEALGLRGSERILEIGCGHGVATRMLCAHVTRGHVIAVDRSARMIAATARACSEYLKSGRLSLIEGHFEDQGYGAPFDCILAINVDFTLQKDRVWAEAIANALRPDGRAVLVLEAPGVGKADGFSSRVAETLKPYGFQVWSELTGKMAVVSARL